MVVCGVADFMGQYAGHLIWSRRTSKQATGDDNMPAGQGEGIHDGNIINPNLQGRHIRIAFSKVSQHDPQGRISSWRAADFCIFNQRGFHLPANPLAPCIGQENGNALRRIIQYEI